MTKFFHQILIGTEFYKADEDTYYIKTGEFEAEEVETGEYAEFNPDEEVEVQLMAA